MKRRVLLFPRYSHGHGMCLVKSVFPSNGGGGEV
jgi:hypothetical protein